MSDHPSCPFCGSGIIPSPGLPGTYQHAANVLECIIGDLGIVNLGAWSLRSQPTREAVIEAARDLVAKTNAMANRTSGLQPSLRQPWLRSLHNLAELIAGIDNGR
jgi:hypothetical protein